MENKNIKSRYEELTKKIEIANHQYYTLDSPVYTDEKYDEMLDELKDLEEKYPELLKESEQSLTKNVGGDVLEGFVRKKHTVPMLSLDKAQDKEKVIKFIKDTEAEDYVLEWKYDGLAFVARFEEGIFVEARTRGNGFEGEVITEQVRTIKSFPEKIPFKGLLEVSGEIYMPFESYQKYNDRQMYLINKEEGKNGLEAATKKYPMLQNPRNGAAGAIRQLNIEETRVRELDASVFNILILEGDKTSMPKTLTETQLYLKEQGFKTTLMLESFNKKDLDDLLNKLDECEKDRENLPFGTAPLKLVFNSNFRGAVPVGWFSLCLRMFFGIDMH